MSDPVVAKVLLLRKNIERALESDASAEEVGDIVTALSEVEMSIEMLRSTKIGVTIAAVRKKFPDEEVGTAAKDMIGKWKVLVPAKSPSNASIGSIGSTGSTDNVSKIITLGAPPKAALEKDPSEQTDRSDSSMSDDPRYAVLPPARKKVRVALCVVRCALCVVRWKWGAVGARLPCLAGLPPLISTLSPPLPPHR